MLKIYFHTLILLQAVIFKLLKKLFNKPILILKRRLKKQNSLNIYYNDLQPCRPNVYDKSKLFYVETSTGDLEVYNASQRLIQLKHLLTSKNGVTKESYLSVLETIKVDLKKNQGVLSSYNYSEAVSNIAHLYLRFSDNGEYINSASRLDKNLRNLLDHISDNPEYYFIVTNNHLLNNARALMLGGLILRECKYISRGIQILNYALRIFGNDNIFRERSTHYHLIIIMWLQDILCVLKQISFDDIHIIADKILSLITANNKITKSIQSHSSAVIPLIGDISPDESPRYTLRFINAISDAQNNNILTVPSWIIDGGWIIYKDRLWSVLACPQKEISLDYPTHGHDDWGSFCLAKYGEDILIDIGRFSYSKNILFNKQISRAGHSSGSIESNGRSIVTSNRFSNTIGINSREIKMDGQALILMETYRKDDFQGHWSREFIIEGKTFSLIDIVSVSKSCNAIFIFYFEKKWFDKHRDRVQFYYETKHNNNEEIVKNITEVERSDEYLSVSKAVKVTLSICISKSFKLKTSII